ncbi:MAG: FGGY-family carbohydrate kinase [Microcoleaceae cyanobacterium]
MSFSLGIDFGTTGARLSLINPQLTVDITAEHQFYPPTRAGDWPSIWRTTLFDLIQKIPIKLRHQIDRIAINGTSATVLLCDNTGFPVDAPIFYNDGRGASVLHQVEAIAPEDHPVQSATSSLAKLFWWHTQLKQAKIQPKDTTNYYKNQPLYFLHQADWLGFLLHGKLGISDYHNALKLGYDVVNFCYPKWLLQSIKNNSDFLPLKLPQVVAPGSPIATVIPDIANRLGLSPSCLICAGTTDSIAAFLASGANTPGEAVTSLGSTLVLKLLSQTPVNAARYGIYSHRLGNLWLTGGASNTGGAVLRHYFTDEQLQHLSQQIDPTQTSPLEYYPLLKKGDRFPINDPDLAPQLQPRPENDVEFLQALLESIARIEAKGYQLLQDLGATPLTQVYTAGGGAKNAVWTSLRQRYLGVTMIKPTQTEAAYGTALLALKGVSDFE